MNPKVMNFYTTVWFFSVVICMILEGSYLGSYQGSVLDDLMLFQRYNPWGLITLYLPNINFFRGIYRLLAWDYSFYSGGYAIIRYFWMAVLMPGMAWGFYQVMLPIGASLLSVLKQLIPGINIG